MRELDVLLLRYLERTATGRVSQAERAAFARLLELPDPDLFGYLVGRTSAPRGRRCAMSSPASASVRLDLPAVTGGRSAAAACVWLAPCGRRGARDRPGVRAGARTPGAAAVVLGGVADSGSGAAPGARLRGRRRSTSVRSRVSLPRTGGRWPVTATGAQPRLLGRSVLLDAVGRPADAGVALLAHPVRRADAARLRRWTIVLRRDARPAGSVTGSPIAVADPCNPCRTFPHPTGL